MSRLTASVMEPLALLNILILALDHAALAILASASSLALEGGAGKQYMTPEGNAIFGLKSNRTNLIERLGPCKCPSDCQTLLQCIRSDGLDEAMGRFAVFMYATTIRKEAGPIPRKE